MKKEKSPVLVISCILLLSAFIILPPLFRYLVPKEINTKTKNAQTKKLQVLKCSKYFPEELYLESINVKYRDGVIDTNTITYKKVEQIPDGVAANSSIKVSDEYNMFTSLKNIEINNNNDLITVIINQKLLDNNLENTNLKNYFQDLTLEQTFYENMGYTCSILES